VALAVAVLADTIQFLLLPLFSEGVLSPFEDALDVAVALAMVALLGRHWAFLPAFVAELVPGVDLFPTWTAAVAFVAWRGRLPQRHSPPP
jgi:hypothetical protein